MPFITETKYIIMSEFGRIAMIAFAIVLFSGSQFAVAIDGIQNRTVERLIVTNLTIMSSWQRSCAECARPYSWSDCLDGKKIRTAYECGESTGYVCQSHVYIQSCSTEPSSQYDFLILAALATMTIGYAGLKSREEKLEIRMHRKKGKVKRFSRQVLKR
jgi:hypothetical protein